MKKHVQLLDCTLRDGAYIVDARFGVPAIKGIIKRLQDANVDIIECGWLKNTSHEQGTSFFHVPNDLKSYYLKKREDVTYVAMIDWDRYDLKYLPLNDGKSLDAIRVVFPHGKHQDGINVGKNIAQKGYKVFFQVANTLAYTDDELVELARCMNQVDPVAVSVVDTFGAMYNEDLERIIQVLHENLNPSIKLGFHSHNNQQLSFALTIRFVELLKKMKRDCIVDASLCGMGRGAGNATTELVANYLNLKQNCNYDMNRIMDAIDTYMQYFQENYTWGYSTPYFIAGMYCCHVNNIAYLLKNHRTTAQDMRSIIESLSIEERTKYDYELLEEKYIENQNRIVDDQLVLEMLENRWRDKEILLIAPGKTSETEKDSILKYIREKHPIVIGVNAISRNYIFDYLFIVNATRYNYAREISPQQFLDTKKILLSNIKTHPGKNEFIINFNRVIKRGWEHFDNAVINMLRLLDKVHVQNVKIVGFDGFKHQYNESYADISLPTLNPDNRWDELNDEIKDMYQDFRQKTRDTMQIEFLTESIFSEIK